MNITMIKCSCSIFLLGASFNLAHANTQICNVAPLVVTTKNVGSVRYYADHCQQNWENQSIRLDFTYSRNIPEWAFKKAARYYLNKNINHLSKDAVLNQITELYKPVKKGDIYSLNYIQGTKTLTLSLNQKVLGSITDSSANQYFKIWFGSSPFDARLKQQL